MSVAILTCCNVRRVDTWRISSRSNHRCYYVLLSPTVASKCRPRRSSRTRDFRRDFAMRRPRTSSREICTVTAASRTRLWVSTLFKLRLSAFTLLLLSGTKTKHSFPKITTRTIRVLKTRTEVCKLFDLLSPLYTPIAVGYFPHLPQLLTMN